MIVLHAIVPRDSAPIAGLRGHDSGDVTVLYEEREDLPSSSRSAVLAHGQRVVAMADRVPLLPVRYGTTLASVDELANLVEERADAWSHRLAEITGRCELVVHVDVAAVPELPPSDESGRTYLRRRMAHVQRQDQALDEARGLLTRWSEETRLLTDRRRIAVLVDRRRVDAARESIAAWGRLRDDLDVVVTGPWPPFSFCEEAELS